MNATKVVPQATTLCALAFLLSLQNPPSQKPGDAKPAGQKPHETSQPAGTAPVRDPLSTQTMQLHRADRVIGLELKDSSGAPIGKIEDLVLNADGSIGYVVVQGNVSGQPKLVPISWSAIQFQAGTDAGTPDATGGKLTTNFTKDRLDTAPSFTADQWPTEGTDNVFAEADAFWGGRGPSSRMPPASGSGKDGRPLDASMRTATHFRSTTLGSRPVNDASGAPIGTLGELVVDPASGRVAYATMRLSGGRVVAVPWSLFQNAPDKRDQLQLSFPQDRLQNAPEFQGGADHWKLMSDPAWVGQVYTYYSVPPYWKGGKSTTPPPTLPPSAPGKQPPPQKDSKPPSGG